MIVDGFMRSGNTYLVSLLRTAFPDTSIGWSDPAHDLTVVQEGGVIQPVREPVGCLTSYLILRQDHSLQAIHEAVELYVEFTNESHKNFVARFEEFTTTPSVFLTQAEALLGERRVAIIPSALQRNLIEAATGADALVDPHTGRVPRSRVQNYQSVRNTVVESPHLAFAQAAYRQVCSG